MKLLFFLITVFSCNVFADVTLIIEGKASRAERVESRNLVNMDPDGLRIQGRGVYFFPNQILAKFHMSKRELATLIEEHMNNGKNLFVYFKTNDDFRVDAINRVRIDLP